MCHRILYFYIVFSVIIFSLAWPPVRKMIMQRWRKFICQWLKKFSVVVLPRSLPICFIHTDLIKIKNWNGIFKNCMFLSNYIKFEPHTLIKNSANEFSICLIKFDKTSNVKKINVALYTKLFNSTNEEFCIKFPSFLNRKMILSICINTM